MLNEMCSNFPKLDKKFVQYKRCYLSKELDIKVYYKFRRDTD